jgi:uncharacterized membrane protein
VDFFVRFSRFRCGARLQPGRFLINVPADKAGKPRRHDGHGGAASQRAAAYYGIGMRTYYFSVPLLLWVFGATWMVISTLGVLLVLNHLDHLPQQD